MKMHAAIDLHSGNNVAVIQDEANRVRRAQKKSPRSDQMH